MNDDVDAIFWTLGKACGNKSCEQPAATVILELVWNTKRHDLRLVCLDHAARIAGKRPDLDFVEVTEFCGYEDCKKAPVLVLAELNWSARKGDVSFLCQEHADRLIAIMQCKGEA